MQLEGPARPSRVRCLALAEGLLVRQSDHHRVGESQTALTEGFPNTRVLILEAKRRIGPYLGKAPGVVQLQGVGVAYRDTLCGLQCESRRPATGVDVDPVSSLTVPVRSIRLVAGRKILGDELAFQRPAPRRLTCCAWTLHRHNHSPILRLDQLAPLLP